MPGSPVRRARKEAAARTAAERIGDVAGEREAPATAPRLEPVEYSDDLIGEMMALARLGYTFAEIASHWCISEETFTGWMNTRSDFEEAAQRARAHAKAWWQGRARIAMTTDNNKFPAGAWSQAMRAMFPEYDKQSVQIAVLDVSRIVLLDLTEPTPDQSAASPKPVTSNEPVRLALGQTGEGSPDLASVSQGEPRSH